MEEDEERALRAEFDEAVNMGPDELREWLDTDESQAVGQKDGGGESKGHEMGRHILEIRAAAEDLSDEQLAQMRKVVGYVHRHLAQGPPKEDAEHSRWRYSLMNWGHDPLRAGPHPTGGGD